MQHVHVKEAYNSSRPKGKQHAWVRCAQAEDTLHFKIGAAACNWAGKVGRPSAWSSKGQGEIHLRSSCHTEEDGQSRHSSLHFTFERFGEFWNGSLYAIWRINVTNLLFLFFARESLQILSDFEKHTAAFTSFSSLIYTRSFHFKLYTVTICWRKQITLFLFFISVSADFNCKAWIHFIFNGRRWCHGWEKHTRTLGWCHRLRVLLLVFN